MMLTSQSLDALASQQSNKLTLVALLICLFGVQFEKRGIVDDHLLSHTGKQVT